MQQKEENNYEEWLERINKAAGIAEQAVVDEVVHEEKVVAKTLKSPSFWKKLSVLVGIFFVAFLPRFIYAFILHDIENAHYSWYGDVYHRWQIAYLSLHVGFSHGFLRLWDLKGLEYFWGLLYPLVQIFFFTVTGSVDIMWIRLFAMVCGSLVVVFLFLLLKRYFNASVALASALFFSFMPIILFSDTTGEQEPLGLALIFGGLLMFPKKPWLTGILFALASMVRAEYWLMTAGLIVVAFLREKEMQKKVLLLFGWSVPILLYMKYLLDQTGNPIYPIYWNFFASVQGDWFKNVVLSQQVLMIKYASIGVFFLALAGILLLFWKRPRYYLLFIFGLANIDFIFYTFGFGKYLNGYIVRFWFDRLFLWPYGFLGILLAVVLLYVLPKYTKLYGMVAGWIVYLVLLVALQWVWIPLNPWIKSADVTWPQEKVLAGHIMQDYTGGSILLPEDRPALTYALVQDGLTGEHVVGQMFDPYYYMSGDPYKNWGKNRKVILDWLKTNTISLVVFYTNRDRYMQLIKHEPKQFQFVETLDDGALQIYRVNQ